MGIDRITNVLIYKDGYYYLTIEKRVYNNDSIGETVYSHIPDEWDLNDGFETKEDAYAYLAKLQGSETSTGALATTGIGGKAKK